MATEMVDQVGGTTSITDQITAAGETVAYKAPVRAATTANISLSSLQTVDGITLAANDRVLVKDQTDAKQNGIYIVSSGNWQRARDFDSNRDVTRGTKVSVVEGTSENREFTLTTANPISVGTSEITFALADDVASAAASAAAAAISETNAAASATAATEKATAAATSEGNAADSATAAAGSASDAADSASAAATSASTATTQAAAASSSASDASTSETNAASSASAAAASASVASSSEANAATSESNAAASASAAATSEGNAADSATAAASSETTATAKATAAASSASDAADSASAAAADKATVAADKATVAGYKTDAESAKTSAQSAQTAAEAARDQTLASFDNFDDRYLGPKSTDPATDNDGNALVAGSLYFNSTAGVMKVYTGSAWVSAYVSGTDFYTKTEGDNRYATAAEGDAANTAVQPGDLAAVATSGSAADLSAGTIPDARLPNRLAIYQAGLEITDWNTAAESGQYRGNAAANAPAALTGWAFGFVDMSSSVYGSQTVWDFTTIASSDMKMWRREIIGGTWGVWYRIRLSEAEQAALWVAIDTDTALTAGYTTTAGNDGTKSSGTYTPSPSGGNLRRIVNGGAFTLAAPSASGDYTMVIQVTNNATAGAITFSGFTKTGGDSFTTTNGDDFLVYITKVNGFTHAQVVALQ